MLQNGAARAAGEREMSSSTWLKPLAALSLVISAATPLQAQVLGGAFAAQYEIDNVGAVPGVPGNYGGIAFDPAAGNRLLIGGNANNNLGAIYSITVRRDAQGHIDGFVGSALKRFDAPFIDGGLTRTQSGVWLYTTFPLNQLGQIPPGASGPTKTTLLSGLGVGGSVGGCTVVDGAGGARIKLTSPGVSRWYDAALTPDGQGTFNVGLATPRGPTVPAAGSMVYIDAGQPGFSAPTALVTSCGGFVGAYTLDSNLDPLVSAGSFVLSLAGCADGLTLDPLTGDLVIAVADLRRIHVVKGFSAITRFCQGTNVVGSCSPRIEFSGTPTLTGPDDFVLRARQLPSGQNTLQIWSFAPTQQFFAGGFLCVGQPLRRIAIPGGNVLPAGAGAGGGANICPALAQVAWTHGFFASNGLLAGDTLYTQFVTRNPAPGSSTALLVSDALRFTVLP
jgi:hypothetical protein